MKKLRVVLYVRVSKPKPMPDGRGGFRQQEPENQVDPMRKFVADRAEWELVHVYEDRDTASKPDRDAFQEMLGDAENSKFDILVFWSLDRFSREGVLATLTHLQRLDKLGIGRCSFTEQYLDTCGVFKDAVIAILATVAKFERVRMSERVKAGIARRKAQNLPVGAPAVAIDMDYFRRASKVYTNRELGELFHVSHTTILKFKRKLRYMDLTPQPLVSQPVSRRSK